MYESPIRLVAGSSSLILRCFTYVFLRWIPGHQAPPIIFACAAVYVLAFIRIMGRADTAPRTHRSTADVELKISQTNDAVRGEQEAWVTAHTMVKLPEILRTRYHKSILILMTGIPDTVHKGWSILSLVINLLLTLMMADLIYRAPTFWQVHDLSFARIGYVSDQNAKLLVREPSQEQWPLSLSYRVSQTEVQGQGAGAWKPAGKVEQLSETTDFTHTFMIHGLLASTWYDYAFSNNHTGSFATAPKPGTSKLTFLSTSCIKPRIPYTPLAHPLEFRGFRYIASIIPRLRPSFMLFLGDFIYIDVPHRFGQSAETYRREYRQVYASPDWPGAAASLPWLHVLDDHEIANDWDAGIGHPYPAATDPWRNYHVLPNPPVVRPNATYFTFTHGPASFFLMDTRRYRSSSTALPPDHPDKTMLGKAQIADLLQFISTEEPPGVYFKFIVSSVPLTRNWRINAADTWSGYLYERQIILEAMWDVSLSPARTGIVVLSGDRHEFAATSFPPPRDGRWPPSATVHEFSTSPLNMFYLPTRSYREKEGDDEICLKYVPDGNSKFGAIEVEGVPGREQGTLKYRLFVDGQETWSHALTTPARAGRLQGRTVL